MKKNFLIASLLAIIGFAIMVVIEVTSPPNAKESIKIVMILYLCIAFISWFIFAIWYVKIGRKQLIAEQKQEEWISSEETKNE